MAGVRSGPHGEAQQVWQVLVLVLLVARGRSAQPPRRQGDRRPRLGRDPQHSAREAHLERHGKNKKYIYIYSQFLHFTVYTCLIILLLSEVSRVTGGSRFSF